MRGSGWLLGFAASGLWLVAFLWPAAALIIAFSMEEAGGDPSYRVAPHFIRTTLAWSFGVAIAAIVIGWPAGIWLSRLIGRRGFPWAAALCMLPVCLPAYLAFYAWEQAWPPGSALSSWAAEHRWTATLRGITLFVGLVSWSWPLVSWTIVGASLVRGNDTDELLRLDGASRWRRAWMRARQDGSALVLGGLFVFIFIHNNTTCFDVAQIRTVGYELRAMDELGASKRRLLAAGWPGMAGAALVALAAWWAIFRRSAHTGGLRRAHPGGGFGFHVALLVAVSIGIPAFLLIRAMPSGDSIARATAAFGGQVVNDVVFAFITGLLALVVFVGLTAMWLDRRAFIRRLATAQAACWLLAAIVPSTVIAQGYVAAYNRELLALDELVYRTEAIVVLARLARFAVLAALAARWAASSEPPERVMLRELDGAGTIVGLWKALRPTWMLTGGALVLVTTFIALGEVPVTVRLAPPVYDPIARVILNALHYQREDFASVMAVLLIAGGGAGAMVIAAIAVLRRRWLGLAPSAAMTLVMSAGIIFATGCSRSPAGQTNGVRLVFGGGGHSEGRFEYPRAMAVDAARGHLIVIDRTARVQRFGLNGAFQRAWMMPEYDQGFPTGVSIDEQGRVFIADTHEHRVVVFDADGRELMRFGRYGAGEGEFVYPTCIAFGPNGRLYVSEYGENERVQVFDADGRFLFAFGRRGTGPGEFNRPQSVVFNHAMTEVFVSDAANHRISVFTPEGEFLRSIGSPGTSPGQFRYPYGLTLLEDGSLLVAEFGNNRIQRIGPDGASLGIWGRPGTGEGEVYSPWATAVAGERIYVLDSRNHRVQVIDRF